MQIPKALDPKSTVELQVSSFSLDLPCIYPIALKTEVVAKRKLSIQTIQSKVALPQVRGSMTIENLPRSEIDLQNKRIIAANPPRSGLFKEAHFLQKIQRALTPQFVAPLDYYGVIARDLQLKNAIQDAGRDPEDFIPKAITEAKDPVKGVELALEAYIGKSPIKNKEMILNILIPGNNDQATALHAAACIKKIEGIVKENDSIESVKINVLVMGKGGHATTARFHKVALLKGNLFEGMTEADILGDTLIAALDQQISKNSKVKVELTRARDSTNTGENVDEARKWIASNALEGSESFQSLLIATTPSSERQRDTFERQLGMDKEGRFIAIRPFVDDTGNFATNEKGDQIYEAVTALRRDQSGSIIYGRPVIKNGKPQKTKDGQAIYREIPKLAKKDKELVRPVYKSLTAIPFPMGIRFLESMSDEQAITEMYAGLAEEAKRFEYPYKDYTVLRPLGAAERQRLTNLYAIYGRLHKQTEEEVRVTPLAELTKYFQEGFFTLEEKIPNGFAKTDRMKGAHCATSCFQIQLLAETERQQPSYKFSEHQVKLLRII